MFKPRLDHLPKLRLSDTCRMLGITPRAFRFYEEQGLLEAHRDSLNHRLIDCATRERVAWIVQLRRAGLTIKEVRAILAEEDGRGAGFDLAMTRLAARREEIVAELEGLDTLVATLNAKGAVPGAVRMPVAA